MARSDPSALRWLIGNELRHYRQLAKQTVTAAAKTLGCTHGKVTHMETGRTAPQPEELVALLRFYGVEQPEIDRLTTLASQSDAATWWAPWANVVPDWFRTFVGLEGLATTAFIYDPTLVPGLLQTEGYARGLTRATVFVRPDHAERFVSFRLARAKRLTELEPLRLHAVVTEAALRMRVATPEVRRAQYEQLVEFAQLPNVTLQVVRPEDGPHAATKGPFVVLDFEHARSVAYAELLDGAMYVQDPDKVASYNIAVESLQQSALQPNESVAFIKTFITGGPDVHPGSGFGQVEQEQLQQ